MSASSPPRDAAAYQHHAAVLAQPPVTAWCPADSEIDFLGTRTRLSYTAGMRQESAARRAETITPSYPSFDNEYFEWVDILETVEAATDSYVMIELGAGYGRWSMRAARAAARKPFCTFQCVAVEAEPVHYRWMLDHFRDNGINPEDHDVMWAAVGAWPGFVPFWIGEPNGWYGQAIASSAQEPLPTARMRRRLKARSILGRPPRTSPAEKSLLWVPCVTLTELLAPYPLVDLIDLDVQGTEFDVLAPAIGLLNQRVRRIHIATHSAQIEEALRVLFGKAGWKKLNDYPCRSRVPTPYGDITFDDGVQTWMNPVRLSSPQSLAWGAQEIERASADATEMFASLLAHVADLTEQNRQLEAEIARQSAESLEVASALRARLAELKERRHERKVKRPRRAVDAPKVIAALQARVEGLKERTHQLKAKTVRLRERRRPARKPSRPKTDTRWWKRLVRGWLAGLRRGLE